MSRIVGMFLLIVGLAAMATPAAQTPVGQKPAAPTPAGDVTVTVSYTGKGVVDAKTDILVFLFDHPNPTAGSQPLGMQSVIKNGGVATFKGIATSPVYVVAVYDEKGGYDGQSGPPPSGTPWAIYGVTAKTPATPVVPGPKGKVTFRFDGSNRFK